jgi:hypothetical protein
MWGVINGSYNNPMQTTLQTLGQKPIPKPLSRLFFNLPQFPPSMILATLL